VIWIGPDGQLRGNVHYPTRNSQAIAVDQSSNVYVCGTWILATVCQNARLFTWDAGATMEVTLRKRRGGGRALVPGRFYVVTREGFLYAIGAGQPLTLGACGCNNQNIGDEKINWLDLANEPIGLRTHRADCSSRMRGLRRRSGSCSGRTVYIPSKSGDLTPLDP
jgi:hypothetical protein